MEQTPQPSSGASAKGPGGVVWLNAFYDPVANLRVFQSSFDLGPVDDTGEHVLVTGDHSTNRLRVYSGVSLASDIALLDTPVACKIFYMDYSPTAPLPPAPDTSAAVPAVPSGGTSQTLLPVVAVATPTTVFIYSALKPFMKYTPPPTLPAQLGASGPSGETILTCMTAMNSGKEEGRTKGSLILGTESCQVMMLESNPLRGVAWTMQLKAVPTMMATSGVLGVGDYRVAVACRNRAVYVLKNGDPTATVAIDLEMQPTSMVIVNKHLFVGLMSGVIQSYQLRGRKSYTLYLPTTSSTEPTQVLALEQLTHPLTGTKALLVALSTGQVRVYNEATKALICEIPGGAESPAPGASGSAPAATAAAAAAGGAATSDASESSSVVAVKFGQYGREKGVLLTVRSNGSLSVKILSRVSSNLAPFNTGSASGPVTTQPTPSEQDVPLRIPKKTSLYVEQTQHERADAVNMHRTFQRELYRLRLDTARAYVKVLTDQQGPVGYCSTGGASLKLSARVQGLGPVYKMRLFVENAAKRTMVGGVQIVFNFNHTLYAIDSGKGGVGSIPLLVPGLAYHYDVKITCLDERGPSEPITVFLCGLMSSLPLIMAVVQMPQTQLLFS